MFVSAVNQLITQKDAIIAALTVSLDTAFDLAGLKAEQAEVESEMAVVSALIEKCIYENAHVALDQVEYQKRYDGLTARFDTAKARHEALDEAIRSKQSRRATIEACLATLAEANLVDTFDTALWCGLVDFVTVHSTDDVRITFRNGMEIKA
jgi:site-specific recombinases, DNA invertase pin homologs